MNSRPNWSRQCSREEKTVSQLAAEHGIHPNQLYQWRNIALAGLPSLFSGQAVQELAAREAAHAAELERLYAEIGRLSTELAWLKNKYGQRNV